MESMGAGEILLTSVDRDGTWQGYDNNLIKQVTDAVSIPVIANGGAGNLTHLEDTLQIYQTSGLALGSGCLSKRNGY